MIALARDTLGGALAIAGQLPDQMGALPGEIARQTFTRGRQLTAAIGAAGAAALASFAAVMLRHLPRHHHPTLA